jgi:hypothetical protein
MATFSETSHPRSVSGLWTAKQHRYPELRLEATADEEQTSEWEARFAELDSAVQVSPQSHQHALALAHDENIDVAAAAQAHEMITAGDLVTLIRDRQIVTAGALANPNLGKLPFIRQAALLADAFPEERLIAARNTALHSELLDILADDSDDFVKAAAEYTIDLNASVETLTGSSTAASDEPVAGRTERVAS